MTVTLSCSSVFRKIVTISPQATPTAARQVWGVLSRVIFSYSFWDMAAFSVKTSSAAYRNFLLAIAPQCLKSPHVLAKRRHRKLGTLLQVHCTFVENVAHVSACLGKLAASTPWCEVKHKYGVRPCPSLE